MIALSPTQPRVKRRQGAAVEALFVAAELPAHIRQQDKDGVFIATFHAPECAAETDPATTWAERITAAFPTAIITDQYDHYAHWRREGYVLMATVQFTFEELVHVG